MAEITYREALNQALDEGVDLSRVEAVADQLEPVSPDLLFMLHSLTTLVGMMV